MLWYLGKLVVWLVLILLLFAHFEMKTRLKVLENCGNLIVVHRTFNLEYFSVFQVLSAEDSEAPGSSPLNRAALAELTNEESVDERSPSLERNRNSMTSESSSSSSNDTLKMRGSYAHMSADEQDDSLSAHSSRSSVMLLGMYTDSL